LEHRSAEIIRKFEPLFEPRSVVLLGASKDPKKWGFIILANLIDGGFRGRIYPVNPREEEILGLRVYRSVKDLPETPDLAVIVVPPSSVVSVVKDCANKGIRAGVVITAGFAEIGDGGERLQREMVQVARSGGMMLMGPNCNGIMNPSNKLYAQMPSIFPPPGPIAIVAQSGTVAISIARRSVVKGFGCSKYISTGNEADLHFEDYLEYLGHNTITASNGMDGLKMLKSEKYDLVITNIVMPYVSGVGIISVIKEESASLPVIAITAHGKTPERLAAEKRADVVLRKPFEMKKLTDYVVELLGC